MKLLSNFGYSLAITILIHDIPEGISMAVPMKNGGMGSLKVIILVVLSGVTTGIRSIFWKYYRKGIRRSNSSMSSFCGGCDVIYSNR